MIRINLGLGRHGVIGAGVGRREPSKRKRGGALKITSTIIITFL